MDVQLKELIERIKNDGVKSAEENAARIISDAQEKAASIIRQAEEEARRMREVAEVDVKRAERSGTEALRQAGRDLLLTVRSSIEDVFDKIIKSEAAKVLDKELMSQAVMAAVKSLSDGGTKALEVQIPDAQFVSIEPGLRGVLASELTQGMEIVPFKGLDAGFRISMKDGSAFYDFSDREIADMLSRYLNPRLGKILSE